MGKTKRYLLSGALCLLLLLAGCGGQPARDRSDTPSKPGGVVQKRDGAYYKDDGPADEIPGGLDSIPDAQPRPEALHRFANRPYVVLGKSYVPNTSLKSMRQRGVASWYGRKFHGQRTSIGEPYDMFAMTAAHPTLALPSYARVTNLGNGKSVVVRVIDRGPFHADRIIDLSYAAAYRLGYINNGRAQVEVETLLPGPSAPPQAEIRTPVPSPVSPVAVKPQSDEFELLVAQFAQEEEEKEEDDDGGVGESAVPAPPPAASELKGVFLQLGAFSSADNAENLRAHLARELDWLSESIQVQSGDGVYRVQLGPYGNRADAGKVAEKIRIALGYQPSFVFR
ncbi:MAG: septal ring lytic transglycosylase RlpA family protein [Candidatus Accumulibacter sp.]|jgi:rare lipoprotein A|nr:septal ring lytic transglycosylase RlpA family protein [Accumulibacter sp.]